MHKAGSQRVGPEINIKLSNTQTITKAIPAPLGMGTL
jgi:hypothetical protein